MININNRKSRIGYPTISAITMQLYSAYTPFSTKHMNELMTKSNPTKKKKKTLILSLVIPCKVKIARQGMIEDFRCCYCSYAVSKLVPFIYYELCI